MVLWSLSCADCLEAMREPGKLFLAVLKTRDGIKLGVHGGRSEYITSNQPGRTQWRGERSPPMPVQGSAFGVCFGVSGSFRSSLQGRPVSVSFYSFKRKAGGKGWLDGKGEEELGGGVGVDYFSAFLSFFLHQSMPYLSPFRPPRPPAPTCIHMHTNLRTHPRT